MFTINKKDAEVIAKQATESFEECLSKVIIAKVQKYWPEFAAAGNYDLDSTFDFFENKLAGHQNFITISFLFHLIHSNEFEIIDQHKSFSLIKPITPQGTIAAGRSIWMINSPLIRYI